MTTIHRWSAVLVGLLLTAGSLASARAQDTSEAGTKRTVSVSGEGIVRVVPDQATVRFGIVTRAEDPEEARRQNAEAAREAMNAVRALGVEERKLRLETLRLQPAREYDPATRQYKELGFDAIRQVVVEVDNLDTLPTLVAEIVQKGANRLEGVSYELRDRTAARDEALRKALTEARDKARLMAATLDARIGPVLTISEQSFDVPRPMLELARGEVALGKDAAPEPEAYAAGELEVRAVVHVVFTLE